MLEGTGITREYSYVAKSELVIEIAALQPGCSYHLVINSSSIMLHPYKGQL